MSNLAYKQDFQGGQGLANDAPFIYVLEDDPDLQSILSFHLQKEGYRVRCQSKAEDLLRLIESAPENLPSLIVIDINLAGHMNGYEVTQILRGQRKTSSIPIVMLTARSEAGDVVKGLNEGADDYLAKPFDMQVLIARLKSCLRRAEKYPYPVAGKKQKLSMSGIDIDPVSHQVIVGDKFLHLTVTEFGLLKSLMSRPNEVLSREDLLIRVSGPGKLVTGRTVDVHIRALREKLARKSKHIVTVRGVGYKFVP